jgi:hypothetical protein
MCKRIFLITKFTKTENYISEFLTSQGSYTDFNNTLMENTRSFSSDSCHSEKITKKSRYHVYDYFIFRPKNILSNAIGILVVKLSKKKEISNPISGLTQEKGLFVAQSSIAINPLKLRET